MNKVFLIELIDMMIGLTDLEKEKLLKLDFEKVEYKYNLALNEKTDEMIG
ncbi:hypothetical protein [Staphylococcus xylosus]|nr:hypothetical protein [Staphylococcus xylosus]MBM6639466.1 hypothetical protein [Staphylococcus xylosus]